MALRTGIDLLEASLQRVWNEHDDAKRLIAVRNLYHVNAVIYEPARAISGHEEISPGESQHQILHALQESVMQLPGDSFTREQGVDCSLAPMSA
jgi:hypothetical protein